MDRGQSAESSPIIASKKVDSQYRMEELLLEELTPDEVREVLQRLGSEELGGSENSRVLDVVELTGTEPVQVGRILADIRKEDWEERFGAILDSHSNRIDRLERSKTTEQKSYVPRRPANPDLARRYDWRTAVTGSTEPSDEERALKIVGVAIVCFIVIVLILVAQSRQAPVPYSDPSTPRGTVVSPDGTRRPMTPGEAAMFEEALMDPQTRPPGR